LVVLSVSDGTHLKFSLLEFGKDHITYAGMPSENVYSLVLQKDWGRWESLEMGQRYTRSRV